ncbi:TPA: signal peptidase I [Candidatus Bipolaricaulota bacterium]|nr:signal peptidase I [Candidatus Bipolaricaulota bacterium]
MMVFMVATMWKIYTKAGQPGWGCLVPIYNAYLMLKIAGRPGWWLLLLFIPFVNWIIGIIVAIEIARNFGKGGWFAAGLIFLPVIFCPIHAFGKAVYSGDSASA